MRQPAETSLFTVHRTLALLCGAFPYSVEGNTEHTAGAGVDTEDTGEDKDFRVRLVRPYSCEHGYNSKRSVWTEPRVELLKKLHREGLSFGLIAKRIGGGFTRSAVIGKAHRLGFAATQERSRRAPRRGKNNNPSGWRGRAHTPKPKPQPRTLYGIGPDPIPPPQANDIAQVSFVDLDERHCRFVTLPEPVGPFQKQFCGEQRIPGSSYCEAHAHRCGEGSRIQQRYVTPNTGRVMLNAAGPLTGEMESV